jgi:hypothetical protein
VTDDDTIIRGRARIAHELGRCERTVTGGYSGASCRRLRMANILRVRSADLQRLKLGDKSLNSKGTKT